MQDFRNLTVWQKAHSLALRTYQITADFPRDELFGLRNSLRRASVDIASHIAEGTGKNSDSEFSHCLNIAFGYASRLEYYALIAADLNLIEELPYSSFQAEIVEVKKLLNGFNRRLRD